MAHKNKAKRVHAFGNDVLGERDATALAHLIKRREVSALEVAKAAVERAERVNTALHAVELPTYEQALRDAVNPPAAGIFAGVPTFIKDNADVSGLPTRTGTRATKGHTAKKHGDFTAQFIRQGFTVLGKTTMPEFGFNASTEFLLDEPTHNPWNTDFSSGGSSGGSAAMVAAGVVPIAHGNDGGGSIRIPAACCGLVGLKPSRGRTKDNAAAASIPINIISEGVLTRSVRDTAAFFYGIEQIYQNPKLPPIGRVEGPGKKRLRIGVVIDSITGTPTDTETRATIEKTVQLLSAMGHRVETMPLPVASEFLEDFALYWGFLAVLITGFGRIAVSPDFDTHKIEPLTRGLIDYYRKRILKTPGMFIRMAQADKTYTEAFQGWDAVLTPVTGHTVPRLGHLSPSLSFEELWERLKAYVSFTPLNNAAGTPAISLPMGMTQEGLPIGVMLQTIPGGERTLLELAYELEAAHPWVKITQ